jgi:excinuclease ABC subunit C
MRSFSGQNDFAAMQETLGRYFNKIEKDDLPDLIVIDGGKGQLHAAEKILKELKIDNIESISLAKRVEEVFKSGQDTSIFLPRSSSALRLLITIRDATHEQAVSFHRLRRQKRTLRSGLDDIKGIGAQTRFLLLKRFGSPDAVLKATEEELLQIKGIGPKLAKQIKKASDEKLSR